MNFRKVLTVILFFSIAAIVSAQNSGPSLQLAISNPEYPVTPGDRYSVAYLQSYGYGSGSLSTGSFDAIVGADYTVDIPLFGSADLSGMTFLEASDLIREMVENVIPDSNPQIVITSIGAFQVILKGEVSTPGFYTCWGLSRLGDIWLQAKTAYSSARRVTLIREGESITFDLFMAIGNSDFSGNPLLQPGDTIVLEKHPLTVTISGEVYHPGAYQLFAGETLEQLITHYAQGMKSLADHREIVVRRVIGGASLESDMQIIDVSADQFSTFVMKDGDRVSVESIQDSLPEITFEGAISLPDSSINGAATVSARFQYTIIPGETLLSACLNIKDKFNTVSDLENAYVIRKGPGNEQSEVSETGGHQFIRANLYDLIYEHDLTQDLILEPEDRIVIPLKQFFVTVTGGVNKPGRVPYIPEKTAEYFILNSGGRSVQNNGSGVDITDFQGNEKEDDAVIMPEDEIYVPRNSFAHIWGTYLTPVFTILGTLTTTALSILSVLEYTGIFD